MKITIGYLYYDLLNLYGDSGNIKALKYHLEEQGVKVDIKNISLNDEKKFDDLDLIYIGSGTNDNLMVALEDLKKDKKNLEKYIKDNKIIIATGNSVELFGNYIVTKEKIKDLKRAVENTKKKNLNYANCVSRFSIWDRHSKWNRYYNLIF